MTNNRRVNKGKKDAIEQGRRLMGLRGNGKGHPLIKQVSSEFGDVEDDYEEEQAIEECFNSRRLRDRSQLKNPNYAEEHSVCKSIEEDHSSRPAKKAKRSRRSKHQNQDVDSAGVSVNAADGVSESLEVVKTEQEPYSPCNTPLEEHDQDGPLSSPQVPYVGAHGNANDNLYPFNHPPFAMDYEAYPAIPFQTFDQPGYAATPHYAPQQMIFPHPYNASRFNLPNTFDGYNEPEAYDTWVNHNPSL